MKNILKEKPKENLSERLLASVKFVPNLKNKKVLDIGCGYGWFELFALKNGVKKIIGTEITLRDLKTVKKYVRDKRAVFTVGNAIDLPFRKNDFDIIVCWEVIEHISINTEGKLFDEANRVLKEKGYFCLSTPYSSFLSTFFDPAWWLKGHRHYDPKKLKKMAEEKGFRVVDIQVKGRLYTLLSLIVMYFTKWILRLPISYPKSFLQKVNSEYKESNGYMDLFMKFQKVESVV